VVVDKISAAGCELPAILTGYEDRMKSGKTVRKAIHEITVTDYFAVYRDTREIVTLPGEFEEFLTDYPECNAHGDVDACGIWVRHADHVKLEEIHIFPRAANERDAVKLYDVKE
jgi:hypothetical protein